MYSFIVNLRDMLLDYHQYITEMFIYYTKNLVYLKALSLYK